MFDTELYAIAELLDIALGEGQNGRRNPFQRAALQWTKVDIWTDSWQRGMEDGEIRGPRHPGGLGTSDGTDFFFISFQIAS